MGTKLLVVGIDALDSEQVARFEGDLPNLSRLEHECPKLALESVCPPDSDTAWASIYTGLNPAQHGIVQYVDPLEKSSRYLSSDIDSATIKGRTFWDIAGQASNRVCVLFPHLGYPVWSVNGVMVGRSAIADSVDTYPRAIASEYDVSRLDVVKGMPGRSKRSYIEANEQLLMAQTEFALEMLLHDDWDLFFVYTSVLDMIQHYFWNLSDESDPSYPGDNPYQDTIKKFYVLHDRMLGQLLNAVDSDTVTIVLSDHGHGMRPLEVFNVNEFLRRQGLLVLKDKPVERRMSRLLDKTKNYALEVVSKYGLGTMASRLLTLMPWARKLYTSPMSIDWDRTVAFATNLSGIKAYTYSGIVIRRDLLGTSRYEEVRELVIQDLAEFRHPESGERLVKWVRRREDVYEGPYISRYPDIVFDLRDGIGVGLTADGSLFGQSPSHHLVPGSHKGDTAMFLLLNANRPICRSKMDLVDVAPTILDILDIELSAELGGKSILRH